MPDISQIRFLLFAIATAVLSTAGGLQVDAGHFLTASAFFVMSMGIVLIWASERIACRVVRDIGQPGKQVLDGITNHIEKKAQLSSEAEGYLRRVCDAIGISPADVEQNKSMIRFVISAAKRQLAAQ